MFEISKLILPNGTELSIKDENARSGAQASESPIQYTYIYAEGIPDWTIGENDEYYADYEFGGLDEVYLAEDMCDLYVVKYYSENEGLVEYTIRDSEELINTCFIITFRNRTKNLRGNMSAYAPTWLAFKNITTGSYFIIPITFHKGTIMGGTTRQIFIPETTRGYLTGGVGIPQLIISEYEPSEAIEGTIWLKPKEDV